MKNLYFIFCLLLFTSNECFSHFNVEQLLLGGGGSNFFVKKKKKKISGGRGAGGRLFGTLEYLWYISKIYVLSYNVLDFRC